MIHRTEKMSGMNTLKTGHGFRNLLSGLAFGVSFLLLLLGAGSCKEDIPTISFEDQERMTIYDYITAHKDKFSSFLSILEKGKLDKTVSAYNPNGTGYTMFLPDNDAVDKFIKESGKYSSLNDLLADTAFVNVLCRYHVVNMSIITDDFPFGALPEFTLSGDQLTVSFVIEPDTSYYKINNQAPVIYQDIELNNGYIDLVSAVLKPVTYTTYDWISENPEFSIFKEAIDAAGLQETFDHSFRDVEAAGQKFTLFLEPDSVFKRRDINSFQELADYLSPGNSDYTSPSNPVNSFLRYHLLTGSRFLYDFVDVVTNYTTYSEVPMFINGEGLDIAINKGMQNFDTLVSGIDTTIIDFVGFYYDESNILTQSGVIHFINQVLEPKKPIRATQTYQFYEEWTFYEYRLKAGTYIVEDSASMNAIHYKGADLYFVLTGDNSSSAWGGDYIFLNGDFTISYQIPKLVQGSYTVVLGAEAFNSQNAVIELSIDGKTVGGLIDLSTGGSAAYPFARFELGTIDFVKYEEHTIAIKSLIPGRFSWDYIRLEPL
jgi:uncharacterized surface protein with fasciclin (FAS1) repeats